MPPNALRRIAGIIMASYVVLAPRVSAFALTSTLVRSRRSLKISQCLSLLTLQPRAAKVDILKHRFAPVETFFHPCKRGIFYNARTAVSAGASGNGQDSGPDRKLKVLGVCGGIGSGKSQACRILASDLGCVEHIDVDSLAHKVYTPGSDALREIEAEFGPSVIQDNGEIDRKSLGSIVFADPKAMSRLESIVWPHTKSLLMARIKEIEADFNRSGSQVENACIIVEAAVMLDAGWEDLFDGIWVVSSPKSLAQKRLIASRGMDSNDADQRIDAQQTRRGIGNLKEEVKSGVVTAVIENDGDINDLSRSLAEALVDPLSWKR